MSDQLYANGRIAVLSNKLLGADKFNRLTDCASVTEALKVLSECGYAGGMTVDNPNDYDRILTAELDIAMSLLKELCFDKNAVAYFLCKYNYHNAKIVMKRKYMRLEGVEHCFDGCGIPAQKLQEAFVNDDYSQVSRNMAEACDAIDTAFADGKRSPQVVDRTLDVAMFADMHTFAKHCSISLVKKLYDWEVNTTNLMLLYRLKKAALGRESLAEWFVPGAGLKLATLMRLWDGEAVELPDEYKQFSKLCAFDNPNLVAAEALQKAHRNQIVAQNADPLTIQPVVKYFFDKVDEIDKVRVILISIKGGIDKDKIKEKIK